MKQTIKRQDGEPCDHAGCLNHVSHPCEGCGRVAGRAVKEMMGIKLEKVCLSEVDGRKELRFDWSNDLHHTVAIQPPYGVTQIAEALSDAAWLIDADPNLATTLMEKDHERPI